MATTIPIRPNYFEWRADLKIGEIDKVMDGVSVEGTITAKGRTRSFISRKTGKRVYVANATLSDDTGDITLVLWNRQILTFDVGDKVRIENGYVTEFNGNLQLNVGKYGTITKI